MRILTDTFPGECVLHLSGALLVCLDGRRYVSIVGNTATDRPYATLHVGVPWFDGETWILLEDLSGGKPRRKHELP